MALTKVTNELIDVEIPAYLKIVGLDIRFCKKENNISLYNMIINIAIYSNSNKKCVVASNSVTISCLSDVLCNISDAYEFLKSGEYSDWTSC